MYADENSRSGNSYTLYKYLDLIANNLDLIPTYKIYRGFSIRHYLRLRNS